jgi:hypothetical protein
VPLLKQNHFFDRSRTPRESFMRRNLNWRLLWEKLCKAAFSKSRMPILWKIGGVGRNWDLQIGNSDIVFPEQSVK